jgi:predicted  nucleic acid-binding Zn-ribbon protein
MQANLQDQQSLLKLAEIDLDIERAKNEQNKIEQAEELTEAREKMLLLADKLIDSRNALSNINLELRRAEDDLRLVETRIEKDNQRLSSTSSSKDAVGMQHELEALKRRKSELEDIELGVLEQKEILENDFAQVSESKSEADKVLGQAEDSLELSLSSVLQKTSDLISEKSRISSTMNPEVLQAYVQRHKRGVAAARLIGRECGACRISITANNYEEISSLPSDQLPECPNCQAFLVR